MKIYSNAKTAELFVNDVSQGKQGGAADGIFIWKNVSLSSGENKIHATATTSGQAVTDECVWKLSLSEPVK